MKTAIHINGITTKNGLLYRCNTMLGTIQADEVAHSNDFTCAERMVRALESVSKYVVPLVDHQPFGTHIQHGIEDSLVMVVSRGDNGWAAGPGPLSFTLLPGQVYAENLIHLFGTSNIVKEVVVVGLHTGIWRTVWAIDDRNITYPGPSVATIHHRATAYHPETPFRVDDFSLVYNLKPTGRYRDGEPEMVNDVAIKIEARHLPEYQRMEIAQTIRVAMNSRYPSHE